MEVYLLKMLICSGLLYGYYRVALYNEHFHQWNRFYLLASIIISIVAPLVTIPFVVETQAETFTNAIDYLNVRATNTAIRQNALTVRDVAAAFVATVSLVMLVRVLTDIVRIIKAGFSNPSESINGNVRFIVTKLSEAPFSFFNWLFWRDDLDVNSRNGRRMLNHELTHIREHHSLDKLITSLVLCVFWVNPFFWLIRRELTIIHEFLADRNAISSKDGADFAQMILLTSPVTKSNLNNLINPFFSSQIKRRLLMITTSKEPRYSYIRRISGFTFMFFIAVSLTISIQQVQAQQTETPPKGKETSAQPIKITVQKTKKSEEANGSKTVIITQKKSATQEQSATPQPLYIIDGKEVAKEHIKEIDANTIKEVNVYKDAKAVEKFGEKGKNGVVEIKSKAAVNSPIVEKTQIAPLYYVNGELSSKDAVDKIEPGRIEKIDVLKGESAVKKYGNDAKGGVIEITLKKQAV